MPIARYWCLLMAIILVTIGGYSIYGYWCLLMTIAGYYINGCWWIFYYQIFVVINVMILMAIGDYFIVGY